MSRWVVVGLGAVALLFVGGGTAAGLCKFAFDCGIRASEPPPTGLEDFTEDSSLEWQVPEGFVGETVVKGLQNPTDLAFLPDGRILVSEKAGLLRTIADGELEPRPFLDIRSKVNNYFFRGTVDVTVDPDFEQNPFVYVTYPVRGPGGADSKEHTVVRLSRFEVRGGMADASSEKVLLGTEGVPGKSCRTLPQTADCLPADGDHIGADIAFGADGSIFYATGDGGGLEVVEPMSFLAQNPDTLGGKILRIDRDGRGLEDNPLWTGDPGANRSKVWAKGMRNPFRIGFAPGDSSTLVVGDVGWNSFEELDVVRAGGDFGWPCFEGPERTPMYESTPFCARYYESSDPVSPWLAVPQPEALSTTAGLPLVAATNWPEAYGDRYLYGDWLKSELYTVPLRLDSPAEEPTLFARNAGGPVAFVLRPDGSLYYLAVNVGELRVIRPA